MAKGISGSDPAGATPLSDEDLDGLIPTFIATRSDLNFAEQANIEAAMRWAFGRRRVASIERLLSIEFCDRVHKRMFGDVWRWAGKRRTRATNIGVDPTQITTQMQLLFGDAKYWHEHDSYSEIERAVRLHHRLVSIHPYRNGNGRHARFIADLYLHALSAPRLTWGMASGERPDIEVRAAYISALVAADKGDIGPLLLIADE